MCFGACKQKPIEHIYYGDWISISKEEYHYDTDSSFYSGEEHWADDMTILSESLHLFEGQVYHQVFRSQSGILKSSNQGQWSMRHNKATLQTDKYLITGTMYVLNGMLHLEGHHYPLDQYKRAEQMKGLRIKGKYRPATNKDVLNNGSNTVRLRDYFK